MAISIHSPKRSVRLIFILFFSGLCSCTQFTVPTKHVVMFNQDGRMLDPTGTIGCNSAPSLCQGSHLGMLPYRELEEQQRAPYVQGLLNGLQQTPPGPDGKRRLLVFVHGGLNTQKASVKRVAKLTPELTAAGYYPLFINWRSSLISSYLDHAFFIRQGERWKLFGPLTSPVVVAADIGRSVVRAPLVWGAQIQGAVQSLPGTDLPQHLDQRKTYLENAYRDDPAHAITFASGDDARGALDKSLSGVSFGLLAPIRMLVAAPIIDGLGTSAWDNMLRRTQLLIHTHAEYRDGHPEESQGDLAMVMRRLEKELAADPNGWEVVLIGHSMGTIVINDLLREFPNLNARTIVYMAAACTVNDFEQSVIPFLQQHPDTDFYNLTLHHKAEERERFDVLFPYFDPAIRGSLLTWIDDFFANPLTPMDKTLGQYVNFLRTEQIIPPSVRGRVHLKEFGVGGRFVESDPQKHGAFGDKPFWEEGFYRK